MLRDGGIPQLPLMNSSELPPSFLSANGPDSLHFPAIGGGSMWKGGLTSQCIPSCFSIAFQGLLL